ncbi:hypothetical protein FITA111629_15190 [Filibacter tadaridae]|uniref:Lumazine-binding domain protein n=1 Tax=Filibacter tadaridae TaxID=2483811 RepID=A0A3P5WF61_9BACL|nr:hypothetical protein [Filibacter tadaridae]VDC18095.1 hypothetical protein FILTAD_00027 [Filibacter tadaridae]
MSKKIPIGLLLLLLLVGCSTEAALTPEMEVEGLLQSYLKALEDNDTTTLVNLSDDLRFPDKKEQLESYLDIDSTVSETRIIELSTISPTEFEATVSLVDDDEQLEFIFPIKQLKNEWKVIVGKDY